ncbi:hypothetical protein [Bradyrhizobium sp. JYMT SZCCT0428]|uniref:hypothetical protein n=1 Tax=Bradyrhizobium sp. JYMT SZCCT0428 TaxID=2807673 RepID=UPI001BA4D30B|nr:hypothetical protein [Bradyrhizobium sp. JYMT SZCCT0428]MBR1156198.1 hypothetical protein [Bradyrhizobium sp. JYMT SZCCT0428]
MTHFNSENRELSIEHLDVATGGGMHFYGMGCSVNQNNAIGEVADAAGSVPVVGGFLKAVVVAVGRGVCAA